MHVGLVGALGMICAINSEGHQKFSVRLVVHGNNPNCKNQIKPVLVWFKYSFLCAMLRQLKTSDWVKNSFNYVLWPNKNSSNS